MKYLGVLFMLILCACNKEMKDPRTISGINPEILPYVQQFESLYGHGIGDIPVQFVKLTGTAVGECHSWSSEYKEIRIDPDFWSGVDDYSKESLVFHELGHCVLNRDHDTNMMDYNTLLVPNSFMYPYIFFNADLAFLNNYYLDEMFSSHNMIVSDAFVRTDHVYSKGGN